MFTTFGHLKMQLDPKQLLASYLVTIATTQHHTYREKKTKQNKLKRKPLLRKKRIGKDIIKCLLLIDWLIDFLTLYCDYTVSGTLRPCPRGQSGLFPNCTGKKKCCYMIQLVGLRPMSKLV